MGDVVINAHINEGLFVVFILNKLIREVWYCLSTIHECRQEMTFHFKDEVWQIRITSYILHITDID